MTRIEWLASGKRRCACKNLILQYFKFQFESTKLSKNWKLDFTKMISGENLSKRKHIVWKAVCSQCEKTYLVYEKRKDLIEALKITGIKYEEKKGLTKNENVLLL